MSLHRRDFLRWSAAGTCSVTLGMSFWRSLYAAPASPGPGPYGPLAATPDSNGFLLPAGFSSRVIGTTGTEVGTTGYVWHLANSEVPLVGGAAMLRFSAAGELTAARRILSGTTANCAGGPTPWGTWLSCEEFELGRVWECYLDGRPAQARPDLGRFSHEAVAVDPLRRALYLTEDQSNGRLYRYLPSTWTDLSRGTLYAARVTWDDGQQLGGTLTWARVPDDVSARVWPMSTYTTGFNGGEGCWYDAGLVYFATKGDNRVWSYDAGSGRLEVVYAAALFPDSPLRGVDNLVVSRSGDIYVAEDGGDMELCLITPDPDRKVSAFLRLLGHAGSEITGPAFNPAGDRLYFSSQRGRNGGGVGVTFEVRGPFRTTR
jgi:secreted PhoX family phosphatase